jgi:hypothetical protein
VLKSKKITIPDALLNGQENRDKGKTFLITEKPAMEIEKWAYRAIMALGSSGIAVSAEIVELGVIGISLLAYQTFMGASFKEIEPLMDQMLECVQMVPSEGVTMPLYAGSIEEVTTLTLLRKEILELHSGFTFAELASKLKAAASARAQASAS